MKLAQLLPNTGVQYIELRGLFTDKELSEAQHPKFDVAAAMALRPVLSRRSAPAGQSGDTDEDGGGVQVEEHERRQEADAEAIVADPEVVMEMARADGGWLPLPFAAPSPLWAMLWLNRSELDHSSWDAVLAIDTTITPQGEGGTLAENCVPQQYSLEGLRLAVFWDAEPVKRYVERHFQRRLTAFGLPAVGAPMIHSRGGLQAHLAGFYHFLVKLDRIPTVKFDAWIPGQSIDVSVVVDLGNSRTCCVLHEMARIEGRKPFYSLELRDPRRPLNIMKGPAHTRIAFVPPFESVLPGAGTFNDLSIVRFGTTALNLLGEAGGDVGARGMSSPKRYMWDNERRSECWQIAQPEAPNARNTIRGALLARMDDAKPWADPTLFQGEPISPRYPRKSGMLFLLVEILEQAFRQVNSPSYRGVDVRQPNSHLRRIIRSIVLMHPAGMHSEEVRQFRLAAERAAQLWAEFRAGPLAFLHGAANTPDDSIGCPVPFVEQECDEGMSIQICYLFSETAHRYHNRTDRLIQVMGRLRQGMPSLRIASIDIGGGTTDLAIADYVPPLGAVAASYNYRRLFHDGFPIGGDDVARELLTAVVFPQVIDQMGLSVSKWNDLFSARWADGERNWMVVRRNLVTSLWMPLVHGCLSRIERDQDVDGALGDLLPVLNEGSIRQLDERLATIVDPALAARKRVGSVRDVRVRVSQADVLPVVSRTIGPALKQYCDIVGQFDVDILVLGGRPSGLPQINRLVNDNIPVRPGAVVFLHEQQWDWFPFSEGGRVGDSKTCSVVGAALGFMAKHDYSNFVLRRSRADVPVPCIHGILVENELVLHPMRLFEDGQKLSNPIPFEGSSIVIGCRHIETPFAIARPIYRLIRDPYIEERLRQAPQNGNEVLHVRLARPDPGSAVLKVNDIKGTVRFIDERGQIREYPNHADVLRCKLQTMLDSDYWLDSGCFPNLALEPGGAVVP